MKRKYAAVVLGLALSVTSMNVFAAETEQTQTDAAETTAVWGEVTAAEKGSITINIAELQDADDTENTGAAEDGETDADAEAEETDADTALSGAENYAKLFTYDGEELTIKLDEETAVQLVYQDADAEKLQEYAVKYSQTETEPETEKKQEEDTVNEPIVAELSIDAILKGDMVYATVDDDGNAECVIVFVPESSAK